MKMLQIIGSGILATILMSAVSLADEGQSMDKGQPMGGDKGEYGAMFKDHHQMSQDMMKMLKEVMGILKGLDEKPTAAEKERLGKMMGQLDDMMAKDEAMMKKAKEMHDQRMEKWKEQHKMMNDHDDTDMKM